MLILQIMMLITAFYFVNTFNILTVWYLAGIYLTLLGLWLLLDDGDIFVAFLWVIDLGVGLMFFMFMLHYSTFLHQKSNLEKTSREFTVTLVALFTLLSILSFMASSVDNSTSAVLSKVWFFSVSWYDYYDFFFSATVTDLNLLHEIYFTNNSFEFFLINFFLLYGMLASILISFLVKRIFNLMNYSQLMNYPFLEQASATYFISTQDYLKQQLTSAGTSIWQKKKNPKL